ncbi:MAG: YceK/YidQ family lipoprotein [Lentisphaeraceae bacterium]|nr:YceK/YidQ family lipoprotein [Lentisphaeraceae bacterium]
MKIVSQVFLFILVLLSCGCKTFLSHGFGANRIYSGTRMTFEMLSQTQEVPESIKVEMAVFNIVDFPLCLAADTIILPITLPSSLFGEYGEFHQMIYPREPHSCEKCSK